MYKIYQISSGETIDSIADMLNVSVNEIKKINGISDDMSLMPGTFIIIPDNNMNNNEYMYYTIQQGDNLYAIAQKYNTDVQTLIELNGLNENDYIYPGENLMIPNSMTKVYITKMGDTLNTLEQGTNKSIGELNKNNTIYVIEGQSIKF